MSKLLVLFFSVALISACSLNINFNQPTPTPNNQPITEPTQITQPEDTSTSNLPTIEEQLITFFAEKFSKQKDEVVLTISQNTGTHALGGIKFAQEMGGGMWLAHLDNSNWIVDYDGNGIIACQQVEPHNYPSSIVSECWDETTNNIKKL